MDFWPDFAKIVCLTFVVVVQRAFDVRHHTVMITLPVTARASKALSASTTFAIG